jgi:hypothetical protein
MMPLITILLIHIGSNVYSVEYPSQMACGEALVAIAEATPPLGGRKTYAQCVRTYAPSQSIRPRARGEIE